MSLSLMTPTDLVTDLLNMIVRGTRLPVKSLHILTNYEIVCFLPADISFVCVSLLDCRLVSHLSFDDFGKK